ncbi:MAG: NUDIX hydrolase [Deltaproteobacteria bacterium]|nr:NUDIX hydrolase [Deltaproteobacteria bacterium]MBW2308339.1 NUDIX hydrolase [Deltaproteobacteria bacterium]
MKPSAPENQGSREGGKIVSSQTIYSGNEFSFRLDELILPNGRRSRQELIVYPAVVCIAAFTDDGRFVLIRQYRHAAGSVLWEAPAGKLLPGEEPDAGAKRELQEETGYRAEQWQRLFAGYIAPGISTEWMSFFLARRLTRGSSHPDVDECIQVQEVPMDNVRDMLNRGEIRDVKSALAVILAMEKLKETM